MTQPKLKTLSQRIDYGIKKAVTLTLAEHKKEGRSIAVWSDGKVVKIPPKKFRSQKNFRKMLKINNLFTL